MRVWPGGPVEPPCSVDITGVRVRLSAGRGLAVTSAVAAGPHATITRLAEPADLAALTAAVDDPDRRADDMDIVLAGVWITGRLCGTGSGVAGWRVGSRLAQALHKEPTMILGHLLATGIDVAAAPAWVLCSGIWHILTSQTDKDARTKVIDDLTRPDKKEPAWLNAEAAAARRDRDSRRRGRPPRKNRRATAAQAAASARKLQEAIRTRQLG